LFGMLQGINAGYAEVIKAQRLDRLLTDPRVPGGAPLPLSDIQKIEQLPGVTRVCGRALLFGSYQDPKNNVIAVATDPDDFFAVRPEYVMPPEQLARLRATRTAIAMPVHIAERFGLKLGDMVPVQSRIPQRNGSPVWTFELVGLFDDPDDPGQAVFSLIRYDYFDEARSTNIGTVDRIIVRIADPTRSAQMGAAIDKLFANSAHETRTQNEKELTESSVKQLGDIGFFTSSIIGAVFFALLFVTGNTMVQSMRERMPEFGVLKTIGFSDRMVFAIVLAESSFLSVVSAAIGLGIAAAYFPQLKNILGLERLSWPVFAVGLAAAVSLAFVSALLPAWRVSRLRIVDALGGR
jgi:putative ABC transport system permease protein